MQNQPDASEAYVLQAELLVDTLSTQKPLFQRGVSEYELIEILKKAPYHFFDDASLREPLMLFKTHFIVFHALYQLKRSWIEQGEGVLDIHTLNIKLNQESAHSDNNSAHSDKNSTHGDNYKDKESQDKVGAITEADALAEYYLDWGNFEKADRKSVDALLNAFWHRMASGNAHTFEQEDIADAHALLGLPQDEHVSLSVLKRVYKKALQLVHPDKGGTQQEAQDVIHAYQLLLGYYSLK
ncbi:MAG: DNA-J related domain-containing protein [Pseudomonadota bacterium]|uniref:DNA-J related domain-containing protein n=1 Tax=Alteromonas TaxID=226 RepID=UPI00066A6DE4|nr:MULTISPECIES: DNA-J related domain-containing protein [Alteromonas]MEC7698491.1 DNA-J related domain-containing protein [Pseudomonadota bacterium]NKX30355.1 molecular chaperone DnaJ [Alteromonadaceae bacterium A_SAG1]MEC9480963.1 DNA-J related domain-containing protein [Pseudomonadota bacterium]MED5334324.1 DNA-J related domain-containing protein [Pseudomonadota bacterium]MED5424742.1 DNA-J related domain-containing protein [Pseudomonadota bacterium]